MQEVSGRMFFCIIALYSGHQMEGVVSDFCQEWKEVQLLLLSKHSMFRRSRINSNGKEVAKDALNIPNT